MPTTHETVLRSRTHELVSSLTLKGMSEQKHYVVGDCLRARLILTPRQHLERATVTVRLQYILSHPPERDAVVAYRLEVARGVLLSVGENYAYKLSIPFHLGRANFSRSGLRGFWLLEVQVDHMVSSVRQTLLKNLRLRQTEAISVSFWIPVEYGRGNYRVEQMALPIPLLNPILTGVSLVAMTVLLALSYFTEYASGNSQGLFEWLLLAILLALISHHYVRLSSFKMTPMEVRPLRDGQLRIQYLNRGNGHLAKCRIGLRLVQKYVKKNEHGKKAYQKDLLYERDYPVEELVRPRGHLNELPLPWPSPSKRKLPTSYDRNGLGYQWEIFLSSPGPILGGHNEISWPIKVKWEGLPLTPSATESEIAEEKLELKALESVRR